MTKPAPATTAALAPADDMLPSRPPATLNILALDIATKTGWAMVIDNVVTSGVVDLKDYDDEGARAVAWFDWLILHPLQHKIDMMVIEAVAGFSFGATAYRVYGLHYVAHLVAFDNQIARRTVPPSTLKKFTTGNGRAKKKDMIAAVQAWGFNPQDDNEADALALLCYAMEKIDVPQ